MALVGRAQELAAIAVASESATGGLLLCGPPGAGKTALLHCLVERTARDSLRTGALPSRRHQPHFVFERALGRTFDVDDDIAIAAHMLDALAGAALVVDDLQWAHTRTLQVLREVARESAVWASVRSGNPDADAAVAWAKQSGATIIDVDELDPDDALELTRQWLPGADVATVAKVAALSGGNPLYIEQLAVAPEHASDLMTPVRLDSLSSVARRALMTLAAARSSVPVALVGMAFDELDSHRLVLRDDDRCRARHELIAEAAMDAASEDERRDAHRRLAEIADDPGDVAFHWHAAGMPEHGVEPALIAATRTSTIEARAEFLTLAALGAFGDPNRQTELGLAAAADHITAGDPARALEVLARLEATDATTRARLGLLSGRARWFLDDPSGSKADIEAALELVSGTTTTIEAELRMERVRYATRVDGDVRLARQYADEAWRVATEVGMPTADIDYMLGGMLALVGHPTAPDVLERAAVDALEVEAFETAMNAANTLAYCVTTIGGLGRVSPVFARVTEAFRHRDRHAWVLAMAETEVHWRFAMSEVDDVIRVGQPLLDSGRPMRRRAPVAAHVAIAYALRADFRNARNVIAEARRHSVGDLTAESHLAWAEAELALLVGRPDLARSRAEVAIGDPHASAAARLGAALAAIHAAVACDQTPSSAAPPRLPQPVFVAARAEYDGACSLAAGDIGAAISEFRTAAEVWPEVNRWAAVRAQLMVGELLLRAGDPEARSTLAAVGDRADELGLVVFAARARRAAGARPVRRRVRTHLLTGRERQVVALAASGSTTREIGAALGIAPSTVETMIRTARTRLGARNRRELVSLAIVTGELDGTE